MKQDRIESLVGWLWTGAMFFVAGLFFLIRGWFMTQVGMPPVDEKGAVLDPQIALRVSPFLIIIGLVIIAAAIVGKLRSQR